jgi:Protein of unknown function (DUF1552)
MFVTKKALPRRTFLAGVGTTLALPLLESMVPAFTALAQTAAKPPLRFGAVYFPNGATNKHWFPDSTGPGYEYKTILKPLEPLRDQISSFGNLSRAGGKTVTDHAVSSAGWLSGAVAKQTEAEDIRVGVSIDQVIAKQVGQETQLPSLELATEDFSGYVGGCVPGYSCAYMNTISWASETAPNPMETNPRTAFERMFGRSSTTAERLQRIQEDRSILDSVAEEARDLQRKVGPRDRARIGDYLDHVREIERRIQRTEAQNAKRVIALDAPLGVPETFEAHAALMFDLLTVAYQSDITRVFSFMMSREASQRTYPELNIPQTHHDISHHGGRPENMELHAKINLHYTQLFAAFVEKLQAMPEGDGTVLDHSLIFYGAGMSDGQAHSPYPLPLVSVGRAGGKMKGDRHIVAAEWTPVANLWLSVANLYGAPLETFAESTGRVGI